MFVSVDIDECEIFQATCHNCTNSDGSYSCSCNAGYTLVDQSMCEGQITTISQYMYVLLSIFAVRRYDIVVCMSVRLSQVGFLLNG